MSLMLLSHVAKFVVSHRGSIGNLYVVNAMYVHCDQTQAQLAFSTTKVTSHYTSLWQLILWAAMLLCGVPWNMH